MLVRRVNRDILLDQANWGSRASLVTKFSSSRIII